MNSQNIQKVLKAMFDLYCFDAKRIQHFTKVFAYASFIGKEEHLDEKTQEIVEIAAIVHDIGIHTCEKKYGKCGGKLQEIEGPKIAKALLCELGICDNVIERVCFLVAHHHTYTADSIDWQILLEADFLVNAFEDDLNIESIKNGYNNIFKTNSGKALCKKMYMGL